MPEYTVPIQGGGYMTVNASDPQAAIENASQGGNVPTGGAPIAGGHMAGGPGNPPGPNYSGTIAGSSGDLSGQGAQQYAAAIQQMLDAVASGNREAFNRAVYEFDVVFQLDRDKFAEDTRRFDQTFGITQAGLTGSYQGAPTLPALTSYANQFGTWGTPTVGQATLAAQQQAYAQQMGMINQAAALQANPFRQQQVLGQLGGLYGGQGVAGFQAPNTVAGVGTAGGNRSGGLGYMQQMIDDIRDPTANQTSMNQILDATPTPNKLNSVDFLRAAPSTQGMVLQAMQEKYGLDPEDSVKQIKNTLPQFQAPSAMGGIKR